MCASVFLCRRVLVHVSALYTFVCIWVFVCAVCTSVCVFVHGDICVCVLCVHLCGGCGHFCVLVCVHCVCTFACYLSMCGCFHVFVCVLRVCVYLCVLSRGKKGQRFHFHFIPFSTSDFILNHGICCFAY